MNKKVAFGTQPGPKAVASLDDLVQSRAEGQGSATAAAVVDAPEKEATRRLSVDLPVSLHTALKLHCVQKGVLIGDYVRDLIAQQFNPAK